MSSPAIIDELYDTLKKLESMIADMDLPEKDKAKLYQIIDEAKQKATLALGIVYHIDNKMTYMIEMLEKISKRLWYIDQAVSGSYRRGRRYGGKKDNKNY